MTTSKIKYPSIKSNTEEVSKTKPNSKLTTKPTAKHTSSNHVEKQILSVIEKTSNSNQEDKKSPVSKIVRKPKKVIKHDRSTIQPNKQSTNRAECLPNKQSSVQSNNRAECLSSIAQSSIQPATMQSIASSPAQSKSVSWDSFLSDLNSNEPIIIPDVIPEIHPRDNNINEYAKPIKVLRNSDDSDFDIFEHKINVHEKNASCNGCGGVLYASGTIVTCQSCGVETSNTSNITEDDYSTSATTNCNISSNGFITLKMVGKGSQRYHRNMLKTCADYSKYSKINTLKDMNNWNSQSKKHHIPKNVILEANDMFAKIKEHGYVFRKDGKKGVLSACLYYACYNNGISKTPSEIAQFSGIEEKFHSLGDRILHDLNERDIIKIPIKINPIEDYVDRYIELLDIPKKYRQFIIELIYRAEKKHIHILHDSKNNTKCVGAIYMLVDRVPELRKKITKEKIDQECGISKTTFIRYYNVLCQYYKKLKKVFKRHQIPMKDEWRD